MAIGRGVEGAVVVVVAVATRGKDEFAGGGV